MLRRRHAFFALAAWLVGAAPAPAASPTNTSGTTIEDGAIAGVPFRVARPTGRWNRQLLLLAHGYRPTSNALVAELDPTRFAHRALLDEGWMIAATSYRRNGVIIADAVDDLDALRAHLVEKYGAPERVLLEGDSMGGLIVTIMAEREPAESRRYHGAIAVGAALDLVDPQSPSGVSLRPKIPLIFLSNQSEFEGPRNYAESKLPPSDDLVRPLLFRVARDGHVNVNQRERLATRRALNLWLDRGRGSIPPAPETPFFDATVKPAAQAPKVLMHPDGRGFDARVVEVTGVYGNMVVDAQPADFASAGIGVMARFQLNAHEKSFRVLLGRDYTSVKRGEWVAFPDAEGFTLLSRSYADAAGTARLTVGDVIRIRRYGTPSDGTEPGER